MKLLFLFFLAFGLLAAPSVAADHEHVTSPLAKLLMHDSLMTNVRTWKHGHSHYTVHGNQIKPDFEGEVTGKYEQVAGKGSYNGTFSGTTTPKKVAGKFTYDTEGSTSYMGLSATFTSEVKGKFYANLKTGKIALNAHATTSLKGSIQRKKVTGNCHSKVDLLISKSQFYLKESGTFDVFFHGKPVHGMYYAGIDKDSAYISLYGKYAGEHFHIKQSFSLNLLKLGVGNTNPMAITRNYGTVSGIADGKKFTQKYDQKGTQMFPSIQ